MLIEFWWGNLLSKKKVKASNPKCRWQRMILECIFREAESVDGKWKKLA